jgi:ankyrin repeat protein
MKMLSAASYDTIALRRMPKNAKMSKVKNEAAAPVQAEEDFDDMLAEVCAADPIVAVATSINTSRSSSSSSSTSSSSLKSATSAPTSTGPKSGVPPEPAEEKVSEDKIVQACIRGDRAQLRRWARRGIRVSSGRPLVQTAAHGNLDVIRYLVNDVGADVNQADDQGFTPLLMAAQNAHLDSMRCLVMELGADVNQTELTGNTPLIIAVLNGHLSVVRCLVDEIGADVNLANEGGLTALMVAASNKHHKIAAYLMRHGEDSQATIPTLGTAADVSKIRGASAEQTAYLEAKTHCSNPGCAGAGAKKCTGCKQARYCGQQCQLAHWQAHKADCKAAAELKAAKDK